VIFPSAVIAMLMQTNGLAIRPFYKKGTLPFSRSILG